MSCRPSSDAEPHVLVVGAGPTGLLLAAELERRGVACLLIDAHDAPLGWDRATVVHARSMEIFEALGLAARFLDEGAKVRAAYFLSDGRTIGVLDLASTGSRYPFDVDVSEDVTESVLTSYLAAHGGSVTRGARLIALSPRAEGVTATIERNGEECEIDVSWVVGCDGYHSAVRELLDIEFPGTDIDAPWAVFDATIDGWSQEFDVVFAHFDVPPVILQPLPGRRWRVYMRPTSDASDLVEDATPIVQRYSPDVTFVDVENASRFRCHSRVAAQFRSGRVLLAGDAAHVCSPAEGHGMNTGMQDAFNLGWKLALVCRGVSGGALLDSYEAERRPVALRVAASGESVESGQAMTAAIDRAARDREIHRTFGESLSAHHEAVATAELDRSYADGGLVGGDENEQLSPGRRLPDTAPVHPSDGEPCALHELTHRPGHTVFVLGGREAAAEDVSELTALVDAAHAGSPAIDAVLGLSTRGPLPGIGRIDDAVADQLGITGVTILAVRPDRYIGFRRDGADVRALDDYLRALTT